VGWIQLAQNLGKWRAVVNKVMKPRVPLNFGNLAS
jgi:hypothetical protein